MDTEQRKIIVITPVKNESWILPHFIEAASIYADQIIISDHMSTDNSVEIAKKYPKVTVIYSTHEKYAEAERRNELLIAARKFGENNLVLAIDADEFLSPTLFSKERLQELKSQKIGTRFFVPLWNIKPGYKQYWNPGMTPVGFIDDGAIHDENNKIHFPRIPQNPALPSVNLDSDALLHLQFIQWDRMESKHRWYKVWETINFPNKSPIDIFRRYDHMNILPESSFRDFPTKWLAEFERHGVDLRELETSPKNFWWDEEVMVLIAQHGLARFRYLDLTNLPKSPDFKLNLIQKFQADCFRAYLWLTKPIHQRSHFWPLRLGLRAVDKVIGVFF